MGTPLLLVAASGLAREAAEAARRSGWDVLGCLDDNPDLTGVEVMPGLRVLGGLDALSGHPEAKVVICAGKGSAREAIATRLAAYGVPDGRYAVVADPSATVGESCVVGLGSVLLAGTTLTASVTVGRHVVCMPRVVLTHDDVVEDFATLCAGAVLGGSVRVGARSYLGMNAAVRQGVHVGPDSILGMGAILLEDLPDGAVRAGNPAAALTRPTNQGTAQ